MPPAISVPRALLARRAPRPAALTRPAVAAALLAPLALLAACGAAAAAGQAARPLAARQAIRLAADQSRRITSLAESVSIRSAGEVSTTVAGTARLRLRPSAAMAARLRASVGGRTIRLAEILTGKAAYLKTSALSRLVSRPWVKVSLTGLPGGTASMLGGLFQSMRGSNPLAQARMLTASKNVRAAGTQVVDGVATTRYVGSYPARAAGAALPASLREGLGPALRMLTGDVRFTVWIDGKHQVRRLAYTEDVSGTKVSATVNVTAINQPVHIAPPPASQVAGLPGASGKGLPTL